MARHFKFAGKALAFVCILCICMRLLYRVMVPKFFSDNDWATTSTYTGFYEMEKNTADVLFFGSSHEVSFFIPQELYNNYGITSYNLGCEQQSLVTSYFWLEEALRFQKPKAVVLDCYMLFTYKSEEALNSEESATRKAFDFMKWSPVKMEAVKTICELDNKQSLMSYYFPNIRYHTRWMGLADNDFAFSEKAGQCKLKGYAQFANYCEYEKYVPFESGASEDETEMIPLMGEYLDKIVALCAQEGILLIMVKTPTTLEDITKYNTLQKYAFNHGLMFLDYNEQGVFDELDFNFSKDNTDGEHGNIWGARKVTNHIGRVLSEDYGIEPKAEEQWENTREYYEGIKKDCELPHISDIDEYLPLLKDDRYSIFVAAQEDFTANLRDTTVQKLRDLGLRADLQGNIQCSYFAVISDGKIEEQSGYDWISQSASVRNGLVPYSIASAGFNCDSASSIQIGDEQFSKKQRGLNIAVYNNETMRVVDSVCFDTCAEGNDAVR